MPLYHVYGISFGNKKPDNVDRDYIVLLSNFIEEGNVQCIVECATPNLLGQPVAADSGLGVLAND